MVWDLLSMIRDYSVLWSILPKASKNRADEKRECCHFRCQILTKAEKGRRKKHSDYFLTKTWPDRKKNWKKKCQTNLNSSPRIGLKGFFFVSYSKKNDLFQHVVCLVFFFCTFSWFFYKVSLSELLTFAACVDMYHCTTATMRCAGVGIRGILCERKREDENWHRDDAKRNETTTIWALSHLFYWIFLFSYVPYPPLCSYLENKSILTIWFACTSNSEIPSMSHVGASVHKNKQAEKQKITNSEKDKKSKLPPSSVHFASFRFVWFRFVWITCCGQIHSNMKLFQDGEKRPFVLISDSQFRLN